MKKVFIRRKTLFIFSILGILLIGVFFAIFAIVYSFSTIKPTSEAINKKLAKYFAKIVYIPEGIEPPSYSFSETSYFWEMETLEKEVTAVRFRFDTGFSKDQKSINATLELPQGGDASIFNKVLPSLISEEQSLMSAKDPQKANLSANNEIGYQSIKLFGREETNQTTQIIWEFNKSNLPEDLKSDYAKITKFPEPILRFFYGIPNLTISLLGG